jgi:hypothetical protein
MKSKTIYIARDFSPAPAGRYPEDGPYNGQRFREALLLPAIRENDEVLVNLDDTGGYGSSFLEEAFGGLIRAGFTASQLHQKLKVVSARQSYESKVWSYIQRAAQAA